MNLQFVLVIYYLTLVRKSLVSVHTLIYLYSNIYFRNFSNFEVSCGSYLIRVHSPLFFCHFSTAIFHMRCPVADHSVTSQLQPFHAECPDPGHFVTSQLQPFHVGCPDPGHGTRNYVQDGDQFCHS